MRLTYNIFDSPFGKTGIAITTYGVCRVILSITEESEFVQSLKTIYHSPKKEPRQLKAIEKEFDLYFSGKLKKFSVKVQMYLQRILSNIYWSLRKYFLGVENDKVNLFDKNWQIINKFSFIDKERNYNIYNLAILLIL
mgnify:CR=1 FL=1